MEAAARAVNAMSKIVATESALNVYLLGGFGLLCFRSVIQQREIDAVEIERDSLTKRNKEMKKTMWDWKQQLYADASHSDSAVVPLAKLKAIYGESNVPPASNPAKDHTKAGSPKFVI